MTFKKGKSGNPAGRKPGTPNKVTATVKAAIEGAFTELGGQTWLIEQAKADPTAFMTLLGKVLPRELAVDLPGATVIVRDFTGRPEAGK